MFKQLWNGVVKCCKRRYERNGFLDDNVVVVQRIHNVLRTFSVKKINRFSCRNLDHSRRVISQNNKEKS